MKNFKARYIDYDGDTYYWFFAASPRDAERIAIETGIAEGWRFSGVEMID